ncbi:MAG: hypothetical protein WC152_02875 [Candidatus Izemoplasmatales bacterium]
MKSDIFILIPCHTVDSYKHLKLKTSDLIDDFAINYIRNMRDIAQSELVERVSNIFERYYLGEYTLPILGDALKGKEVVSLARIKLFITVCERTKLSVLTGIICDFEGNVTNVLDQITREQLVLDLNTRFTNLSAFLQEEYNIIKNGEAKTCLTQSTLAESDEIIYYMANETNESQLVVNTKIISEKYKKFAIDNLAVYDFSDIYVSEATIYQVLSENFSSEKMQYEGLLIFIVELLVMQLSAVYRTNNKVSLALEENKSINVKEYEILSNEFANTLSIWQINIYRYKGAQTIANAIAERFEIDKVRKNYKQNDEFLQSIINTRNVKNSIKESNILFYVAILLFIKDFYIIVRNIYLFIVESQSFSFGDVFSLSTSFVILLIVLFIYHGRTKKLGSRK